jgi:hypothetical protein
LAFSTYLPGSPNGCWPLIATLLDRPLHSGTSATLTPRQAASAVA